jgi:hypothetical protein
MQEAIGCQIGCQEEEEAPDNLQETGDSLENLVTLNFASWNRVVSWLRQLEVIRAAA